ncbi:MAG: ABC transporter permease [Halobacteriaceae archaeon]
MSPFDEAERRSRPLRLPAVGGSLEAVRERARPSRAVALPGALFVGGLLGVELLLPAAGVPRYLLPRPSVVARALVAHRAAILANLRVTLVEFGVGFGATVATGYLLALAMTYSETVETTVYPYVILVRSVPIVTLLPVFIVWFGFGFNSVVVVSYLISVFPMIVNARSGFQSADDRVLQMLESFSATRLDLYRHVYRYAALPAIFAGLKVCTLLAFTGAIVGEFLLGSRGIGVLILSYNGSMDTPAMFAAVLAVSATELAIVGVVHRLERRVVHWQ